MIKFKIKFEIIFVKLKLKSKQIQETTAFSFIGNQELRQSLEASASGYNNLADDPDLHPYGSEAFLQSIADATTTNTSQDSSNPIACVHFVNENETKNDNENENEKKTTLKFQETAASSDVQQELRQRLGEAFPWASAARLQSITHDAVAAMPQDSSSLIVAFASLTKLKRKQIQRKMTTKTKTNSGD